MLFLYLKSRIKVIIMYTVFVLVFSMVFSLYTLPVEAVMYATLLCIIVAIIYSIFDFIKYFNRHKTLTRLLNEVTVHIDGLPHANDILEKDYQNLIEAIHRDKINLISIADGEKSDLLEYYTLWAHQIKTPIAAMRLLLQSEKEINTSHLSMELFKIEQYVEMVLQYLRLNSTSTDFVLKHYDLDSIIKQSVRKYSKMFISKKISLEYSDVNCSVLTDEKWLVFVAEQILSNALKYTPKGKISIYMENKDSKVLVIKDTGIGIAEEDLPRVCENGFTGYNGRIDKKSTGIGLYLCKTILNKLSHKISIESTIEEGTTVKIDLTTKNLEVE